MNYLKYYILASLLVCTVGPAGTGSESERVQRLFNIMQTSMEECPKRGMSRLSFYSCPSYFWPEIMYNFVPVVKSLGSWIRARIGVDAKIWYRMLYYGGVTILKFNAKELREVIDEGKAWTLLNHYLKFGEYKHIMSLRCLTNTLNSLTDIDLTRVSMLPYGGNRDRFDEINRI